MSTRECPKILINCQITKRDMGFQKKHISTRSEKVDFFNRAVSQTVPLKHFNFLNKMVNLDLTLQKKALFSFNRALTGLKVVTEKIIWVSTQIGCSRAGLQPSVN